MVFWEPENAKFWKQVSKCLVYRNAYVTLDHKTSHKGQFFKIEIYTSSETWINVKCENLESEGAKKS